MLSQYYKIMDFENGKLKTLFHANNGSKSVPMREWIESSKYDIVHDGSNGTPYMSGWHIMPDYDETEKYLFNSFKNIKPKVIVSCIVFGDIRKKEHSRSNIWLAQNIYIKEFLMFASEMTS